MAEIQNFGEHIGGSRADMWRAGKLTVDEILGMTDEEVTTFVTRDSLWAREKPEDAVYKNHKSPALAYFQNAIRTSLPAKPLKPGKEQAENYAKVVTAIKGMVMGSDAVCMGVDPNTGDKKKIRELVLGTFCEASSYGFGLKIKPEAEAALDRKVFKAVQKSDYSYKREADKKNYGLTKEDTAQKIADASYEVVPFKGILKGKDKIEAHLKEARANSTGDHGSAYFEYDELYDDKGNRKMEERNGEFRPGRAQLVVPTNFGRAFHYIYGNNTELQPEKWQEDSYFILNSRSRDIVKINLSLEEAERLKEQCIEIDKALQLQELEQKSRSKKKTGKKKFVPETLQNVEQIGGAADTSRTDITGEDMIKAFGFHGGEFGNWTNQNERQHNLNMCFNSLLNLAKAMNIAPEDISFGGELSIAFGARGRGNGALAHYEPTYKVINLTKETTTRKTGGAGALGHEWGHALDAWIGNLAGYKCTLLSERYEADSYRTSKNENVPQSAIDLFRALKYKTIVEKLDYSPQINKESKQLEEAIDAHKPANMTAEQAREWEETRNAIISNPLPHYMYNSPNNDGFDSLMKLSDIKKACTGKKILADSRVYIAMRAGMLHSTKWRAENQPENGKEREVETDLFKGSKVFDKMFSKESKGYWSSSCEMLARAFDCYLHDKLKEMDIRDDYLSAYSEAYSVTADNGNKYSAIPQGEERQRLNQLFEKLFDDLRETKLDPYHDTEIGKPEKPEIEEHESKIDYTIFGQSGFEQMNLFSQESALTR